HRGEEALDEPAHAVGVPAEPIEPELDGVLVVLRLVDCLGVGEELGRLLGGEDLGRGAAGGAAVAVRWLVGVVGFLASEEGHGWLSSIDPAVACGRRRAGRIVGKSGRLFTWTSPFARSSARVPIRSADAGRSRATPHPAVSRSGTTPEGGARCAQRRG